MDRYAFDPGHLALIVAVLPAQRNARNLTRVSNCSCICRSAPRQEADHQLRLLQPPLQPQQLLQPLAQQQQQQQQKWAPGPTQGAPIASVLSGGSSELVDSMAMQRSQSLHGGDDRSALGAGKRLTLAQLEVRQPPRWISYMPPGLCCISPVGFRGWNVGAVQ